MGSLYRSKHELVFVFKVGKGCAHQQRRARAAWPAPDQCLGLCQPERLERQLRRASLSLHPTVKPVAMIADAIRDCSNRGGSDPRSIRWRRHDRDRGGADRPPGPCDRARSDLCRRQHRALAAADRRHRASMPTVVSRSCGLAAFQTADTNGGGVRCPDVGRPPHSRRRRATTVGYGRPPTHSRFQPGQSGNPAGRRKGVRNLMTDVKRMLATPVKVKAGRPYAKEINPGSCPHGVAREGASR